MAAIVIDISDEQLLQILGDAQNQKIPLDSLIEAIFQCGMRFYDGEGNL